MRVNYMLNYAKKNHTLHENTFYFLRRLEEAPWRAPKRLEPPQKCPRDLRKNAKIIINL